jgi:DNA-binding MarR family transcriptional regulator
MKRKFERSAMHAGLEALRHSPGVCTCQKLRRASRTATRLYDEHLRPAGITISQYGVLAALYYVCSMPLLKLAKRLETDRTTLTRSLERLERDGLVSIGLDPEDTRIRAIAITEAGLQKLVQAYPLWMTAQREMANALGARQLKEFRASLDGSIEALASYG